MLLVSNVKSFDEDEEEEEESDGEYEEAENALKERLEDEEKMRLYSKKNKIEELPNALNFISNSEKEHMKNFKKISEVLKDYEEEYSSCIKAIDDGDFSNDKISECVGRNFIKVVLNVKYETLKAMAIADTTVRRYFLDFCYRPAGTVEEFSTGCDIMESDTIDMIWNGFDFIDLLEDNREKYLEEYGKIPSGAFYELLSQLSIFSKEFFEILDEIDSHKEVVIIRLKTLIEDRRRLILEEDKVHPDFGTPILDTNRARPSKIMFDRRTLQRFGNSDHRPKSVSMSQSEDPSAGRLIQQVHTKRPINGYLDEFSSHLDKGKFESGEERTNGNRVLNSGHRYGGLHTKHNTSGFAMPGFGDQKMNFESSTYPFRGSQSSENHQHRRQNLPELTSDHKGFF
jgi:hypothetical protein